MKSVAPPACLAKPSPQIPGLMGFSCLLALIVSLLAPPLSLRAADVPAQPLAKKGELLFSDDFAGPEVGKAWRITHPTFVIADGAFKASQTKDDHAAGARVLAGRKDLVIEFKFRLDGSDHVNAVCNDSGYKEGHAGHICRVSLSPTQVFLGDDKERLRHEIEEMSKDPAKKAEVARLTAGRTAGFRAQIEPGRWYALVWEIVGDETRVSLDGKAVAYLKSSGLAHPMKTDFNFSVSGKDALFDDLRIWAAEP